MVPMDEWQSRRPGAGLPEDQVQGRRGGGRGCEAELCAPHLGTSAAAGRKHVGGGGCPRSQGPSLPSPPSPGAEPHLQTPGRHSHRGRP